MEHMGPSPIIAPQAPAPQMTLDPKSQEFLNKLNVSLGIALPQVAAPKAPLAANPGVPTNVQAKQKKDYGTAGGAEHTSARKSKENTHQAGQARKNQDRQGSGGMSNPPRRRPDGWKGPWPPKKSDPPPQTPPATPPATPPPTQNPPA